MFQDSSKSPGTWNGTRVFAGQSSGPIFSTLMDISGPLLELLMSLSFCGRKTQSERRPAAPRRGRACVSAGGSSLWLLSLHRDRSDIARLGPPARASREEEPERRRQRMIQQRVVPLYRIVPRRCLCVLEQKPLTQTPPPDRPTHPAFESHFLTHSTELTHTEASSLL